MDKLNIVVADSILKRLVGFIGRKHIKPNEAILFPCCSRIHTYFMNIPIDVIFLDNKCRVIKIFSSFSPWRVTPRVKGAVSCLEMANGAAGIFGIVPDLRINACAYIMDKMRFDIT